MQLPLFPFQEITLASFLPEDRMRVEDIALAVAESGTLTYGEPLHEYFDEKKFKYKNIPREELKELRLNKISRFLSEPPDCGEYYTIRHGHEIIGFAAFWDGWVACESGPPMIELAFLHPDFKHKEYVSC